MVYRPVIAAWATFYPNGSTSSVHLGNHPPTAEPLYRHPQRLTQQEKEAVMCAVWDFEQAGCKSDAETLRNLVNRLGSANMGDIVDQLRERSYGTKAKDFLCERAADEIESLREMVEKLSARAKALDEARHKSSTY
jgi:hypothetical protein